MVKTTLLSLKSHKQSSEVGSPQIQGEVFSMLLKNKKKKAFNCSLFSLETKLNETVKIYTLSQFWFQTCAIRSVVHKRRQHLDRKGTFTLQPCLQPGPHPFLDHLQLLLAQSECRQCLVHLQSQRYCSSDDVHLRPAVEKSHMRHLSSLRHQPLGHCCH